MDRAHKATSYRRLPLTRIEVLRRFSAQLRFGLERSSAALSLRASRVDCFRLDAGASCPSPDPAPLPLGIREPARLWMKH